MVSIIIVEYHSREEVLTCVEALQRHLHVSYEVFISSNSCYDTQTQKQLDDTDEHVHWIFNPRNGGFAYAMNEGLRQAKGDTLLIMNSDCLLNGDLGEMVDFLRHHPEVGAIAPQMRDEKGHIQDTARPYVSLSRYLVRQMKRLIGHSESILDKMDYSRIQTVDWLIGAFLMVSREAYERTGGLDDNMFMYAEDLDWCTRIRQQGLEVVYYPRVEVIYKGTRRARWHWKYARIFIRSHMIYWRKFGFFTGYPQRKEIFYSDD